MERSELISSIALAYLPNSIPNYAVQNLQYLKNAFPNFEMILIGDIPSNLEVAYLDSVSGIHVPSSSTWREV